MKIDLIRLLKNNIKKSKFLFWCLFHPDNLFKFKFANKSEKITWGFLKKEMPYYKSFCEIGCFNGRTILNLKYYLKNKIYIGYDLNIFAIFIAKTLNFLLAKNQNYFYCQNAIFSAKQDCELFISIATLIYFSEIELKVFIKELKKNKSFKSLVMHEIFIDENIIQNKRTFVDDNLNLHSISMIEDEFGKDYIIEIYRTYYSDWESKDRISAILSIKKL